MIKRITISVPARTARRIKEAAGDKPVSAWVSELIEESLDDAELERLWREFYQSVKPTPREIKRGDELFQRLTAPGRRRRVA